MMKDAKISKTQSAIWQQVPVNVTEVKDIYILMEHV